MLVVMVLTGGLTHVRWTIFIAILVSSLTTILVPPLYDWNIHSTLVLKIIQGASVAPTVPLVGHVTAYWTPRAEIGLFVSLLTSYSQIGLFYLMATSGITCEYFAWRGIFYLNGFTSLLFGILWILLFRDHPSDLKRKEKTGEEPSKVIARPKHEPVPYKAFFTSLPIWSCLIAAFGNFGGISPFMTFAPAILKKAVNLSDIAASYYNTFSFILQLFLKIFSGKMSDLWTSMSETNKVRLFNTLSMGVAGALCISTAFIPVEHQVVCAVLISLLQGTIGFNSAGYNKAAVIVARQHAHLLLTCFGLIVTFVTLIQPFIVQLVAPDHTWDQWYYLFIGNGLVLVLSNLIFCVTIQAKPAAFTEKSAVSNRTIGFNSAGYNKAAVIVARQHAHLLLTCFGLIVTFVTLIQPFIVQLVAPDHTWDQWYYLFIGNGLVLVLSNLIFCVTIQAKPAAFTEKSAVSNSNSA
ncbi:transporter, major facilitator family protein [Oesophagostomum dentatum]|uniref:Transporter, major facilitator family protein n=1 Tax=Oesophagostomum dentatum TaxID=61180 RepID=A0A0B1T7A3_OESDE|nr:transporter, major facilitator family protein [Oesophagostomum dentatum]